MKSFKENAYILFFRVKFLPYNKASQETTSSSSSEHENWLIFDKLINFQSRLLKNI